MLISRSKKISWVTPFTSYSACFFVCFLIPQHCRISLFRRCWGIFYNNRSEEGPRGEKKKQDWWMAGACLSVYGCDNKPCFVKFHITHNNYKQWKSMMYCSLMIVVIVGCCGIMWGLGSTNSARFWHDCVMAGKIPGLHQNIKVRNNEQPLQSDLIEEWWCGIWESQRHPNANYGMPKNSHIFLPSLTTPMICLQ